MTAGEAKDPGKAIPKALRTMVGRLIIFYVGAVSILLALLPLAIGNVASAQSNALVLAAMLSTIVAIDAGKWIGAAMLMTLGEVVTTTATAFGTRNRITRGVIARRVPTGNWR